MTPGYGLRHTDVVLHLRITTPADLTDQILEALTGDEAVSTLAVLRGAAIDPEGDIVLADVAREGANEIVERLEALGLPHRGTIHVEPVTTWVSQAGLDAARQTPGSGADAVVWADVTQRAYEQSELNWTYLAFMTMATLLASIAIVLDSQILVIGAMVLGPEFVAVAALGLAVVRRRGHLFHRAAQTLVTGFVLAIGLTILFALLARALGWVVVADVTRERPGTAFIYSPDKWSFIVAVIAAAAGVLSLTSSRLGGLSGVFISLTTIPAAGNVALGVAFGVADELWGSLLQLGINIIGMVLAGALTLALQQAAGNRSERRRRAAARSV